MRIFFNLFIAAAIALLAMACNSNENLISKNPQPANQSPSAATQPADNARRITADEVHKLWEKNDVLIIDTRAESAYKQEHIKGSISIPTGTVLAHLDELPKNKLIVAYCT